MEYIYYNPRRDAVFKVRGRTPREVKLNALLDLFFSQYPELPQAEVISNSYLHNPAMVELGEKLEMTVAGLNKENMQTIEDPEELEKAMELKLLEVFKIPSKDLNSSPSSPSNGGRGLVPRSIKDMDPMDHRNPGPAPSPTGRPIPMIASPSPFASAPQEYPNRYKPSARFRSNMSTSGSVPRSPSSPSRSNLSPLRPVPSSPSRSNLSPLGPVPSSPSRSNLSPLGPVPSSPSRSNLQGSTLGSLSRSTLPRSPSSPSRSNLSPLGPVPSSPSRSNLSRSTLGSDLRLPTVELSNLKL
jgi:hypothetical protein